MENETTTLSAQQLLSWLMLGSDDDNDEDILPESESVFGPLPQLSDYEILGKIGEAGQGQVWHSRHLGTRKEVAIKTPRFPGYSGQQLFKRFEREIGIISSIEHPNIVKILDSGIHKGVYFYAMELIHGEHLDTYVQCQNPDKKEILTLFSKICSAVEFMHHMGVVHRDLKPSNILVDNSGVAHILDFGLAKFDGEDDFALTLTCEYSRAGTPAFMSPEQASGNSGNAGVGSDIFSLGVILYNLLTGEYPIDLSGSRDEVLERISQAKIRPLSDKLDSELKKIFRHVFQKLPEDRYKSADEFRNDIQNYLDNKPLLAGSGSAGYKLCRYAKRHTAAIATGTLLAMAAVSTLGYFWHYQKHNFREQFNYPQGTELAGTGHWQQIRSTYPEAIPSIVINGQIKEITPTATDYVVVSDYSLHVLSQERFYQNPGDSIKGSVDISYDGYWPEMAGLAFGIQDKDNFYFAELATKTNAKDSLNLKKMQNGEIIEIAFKNQLELDTSHTLLLEADYNSDDNTISLELTDKTTGKLAVGIYGLTDTSFKNGQVGIITQNASHTFLDNFTVTRK